MGIYNLGGGGGAPELQAKEATPLITNAQQIILPDEGYDGLSKVTVNPMPTGTLKTPTVNSIGYVSSGVQMAGYLNTSATSGLQLSTQSAKTITPTTYSQTAVASGKYTTGAVTVAGDANLVSGNIISGKSIFGVAGNVTQARGLDLVNFTKLSNNKLRFTLSNGQLSIPWMVYGFAVAKVSSESTVSSYIYKISFSTFWNVTQTTTHYESLCPIAFGSDTSPECTRLTVILTIESNTSLTVEVAGSAGIFGYSTYAAGIYGGGYL